MIRNGTVPSMKREQKGNQKDKKPPSYYIICVIYVI